MRPVLFYLGGTPVSSYYTIITIATFVAIFVYLYFAKIFKINEKLTVDSAIVVVATAFPGARLFHVLFEMPEFYFAHPIKIFAIWEGGFVFYGSVFVPIVALVLFLFLKRELKFLLKLTDAFVIALSLGSFIGRWACFFEGCCYGKASNLPWSVIFHDHQSSAPLGVSLHPTQLYMSFYNLIIFIILLIFYKYFYLLKQSSVKQVRNGTKFGTITALYLILYSVSRFIVEYFRADFRGNLFKPYFSTSQFISVIIIIFSFGFLYKLYKKD